MTGEVELPGVGRTGGARNAFVQGLMNQAVASGKCGFCPESFEARNAAFVEAIDEVEQSYWNVWNNPSPMPGSKHHFLAAPMKDHVLYSAEVPADALLVLERIKSALQAKYQYAGYSVLVRQGDPRFNSATVFHLHYHIIVSSGEVASIDEIPEEYLQQIQIVYEVLGQDLERLDELRDCMDVFRAAALSKARPIRVKLSNKSGNNLLD